MEKKILFAAIMLCHVLRDCNGEDFSDGREVLLKVVEYRENIAQFSGFFERAIGAPDWPSENQEANSFEVWSDFTRDRHRIDLNLSGFREVYCRNCQEQDSYFEYLEAPGVNTCKFDKGTVAPQFLMNIRRFGVHCERASWLPGGFLVDDFPIGKAGHEIVLSAAVPEDLVIHLKGDGVIGDRSANLVLLSYSISTNARQRVLVNIDAGPSVVWSEVSADVADERGGNVLFRKEMIAGLQEVESDRWYPAFVTFRQYYDEKLQYMERVTVENCSFQSIQDPIFSLQGIGLRENTLVSGLARGGLWEYKNGDLVVFKNEAESSPVESQNLQGAWMRFAVINIIAFGVLLCAVLYRYKKAPSANGA